VRARISKLSHINVYQPYTFVYWLTTGGGVKKAAAWRGGGIGVGGIGVERISIVVCVVAARTDDAGQRGVDVCCQRMAAL